MNKEKIRSASMYALVVLLFLVIAGFLGWYLWFQSEKTALEDLGQSRGFGEANPTFTGSQGSTNANLGVSVGSGGDLSIVASSTTTQDLGGRATSTPAVWRVSTTPASAISIFPTHTGFRALVIERSSGNVFQVDPITGKAVRVTNTLIPLIYESYWITDKDVLLRSMNERGVGSTFLGSITTSSSSPVGTLSGEYLTPGITAIAVHNQDASFFMMEPRSSGGYTGTITSIETGDKVRVFTSMIGGWRAQWHGESLYIAPKATYGVRESAYHIDTENRRTIPVLEDVAGLSAAFSKEESVVLYSESYVESLETLLRTSEGTRKLSIRTLGEKCTWHPDAAYAICAVPETLGSQPLPDSWYDGETHFSDTLWKVHTETGEVEEMARLSSFFGSPVDVIDPQIDESGIFLSFIDKNSGMPWVLRINEL